MLFLGVSPKGKGKIHSGFIGAFKIGLGVTDK